MRRNRDDRMGGELDFDPWFQDTTMEAQQARVSYLRGRLTSRISMIFNFFAFDMNWV